MSVYKLTSATNCFRQKLLAIIWVFLCLSLHRTSDSIVCHDYKLPTLDCNIWISRPHDQAPAFEFDFYEKPMKSKYVVMVKSAMDYQQNISILSNAGVLRQNFKKAVYCLRSIILASEVYFLAQYQYIYAIFIVVLG